MSHPFHEFESRLKFSRYTRISVLLAAAPVAGRDHPGILRRLGLFHELQSFNSKISTEIPVIILGNPNR
jgi:hypothetical protein